MSEAVINQATAILLPSAGVAVFSNDEDTLSAAQSLSHDWRFARVGVDVRQGDVDVAIHCYAETASPELLIIQTDVINEQFTAKLGELAGYCTEGTAAIVVGPDNDVNLYRNLIDMGVSDYLVRPLTVAALSEVIAKTLIEKLGISGSRLVAFIGAKGGVGTSAIAQASAWGVSEILGQKTLFIDAAGGWSVASVGMGFEPATTLAEAVGAAENDDEDSIKRMIFSASDKLSVLASGGEIMMEAGLSGSELERLLDYVMMKYPAVVVDLSHAAPSLIYSVLNKANQTIVVSSASVSSLRLSRSLIQEVKNLRGEGDDTIDFILNMHGVSSISEVPVVDIEKAMELKPSAVIPFNPDLFGVSESQGKKLLDHKDGARMIKSQLMPIMKKSFKVDVDLSVDAPSKDNMFSGLLSKIKAK
ncbi:AAA family ATPase [Alphaproteobacteria bacterium]|nr:AAA family ATPase [Alphaproteobacteria bacterium]